MQGDEKQKQGQSIEDTKETAGRTEEQGSFEEKERKSFIISLLFMVKPNASQQRSNASTFRPSYFNLV